MKFVVLTILFFFLFMSVFMTIYSWLYVRKASEASVDIGMEVPHSLRSFLHVARILLVLSICIILLFIILQFTHI